MASRPETMQRNAGFFWATTQLSFLWGNLIFAALTQGRSVVDDQTRVAIFSALIATTVAALLLYLPLQSRRDAVRAPIKHMMRQPLHLLRRRTTLYLLMIMLFLGIQTAFFSSLYGTAVGNTGNVTNF